MVHVLRCFLDDSKDRTQDMVMVSAGFYGTQQEWGSLSVTWKNVLDKHDLKYFKSSEYHRLDGEFARFRTNAYPIPTGRQAADAIAAELRSIVENHRGITGLGISVLLKDYKKVYSRPEAKGLLPRNPYHAALDSVVFETAKIVKSTSQRHRVAFFHDDGPDFNSLRSSYEKFRAVNPTVSKVLGGFLPLDDKEHPPLQAADMMSNYAMQLTLEGIRTGNMKANVKEMKKNIRLLGFWSEEYVLSILKHQLLRKGLPIPIDLRDKKYD